MTILKKEYSVYSQYSFDVGFIKHSKDVETFTYIKKYVEAKPQFYTHAENVHDQF
jgi:hypothetical protein